MRLIDADVCWDRILNGCCATETAVMNTPTIDPVHAANTCYCKECWYYTEWGECKEFGEIMKPDEFCSRGVMKNGETLDANKLLKEIEEKYAQ